MPFKNQKLNPFQALVAILAVGALAGLVYLIYQTGSHVWHQRQIKAGIPNYLTHLRTQRDGLIQAIENYHAHFGFYPPNHSTNKTQRAMINPLYYELAGTRWNPQYKSFGVSTAKETISGDTMEKFFNMRSFSNFLAYPLWPTNFTSRGDFTIREDEDIMMVGYSIPGEVETDIDDGFRISTWRYAAEPAEHNVGKFDIWIEVEVLGQRMVVGNWPDAR